MITQAQIITYLKKMVILLAATYGINVLYFYRNGYIPTSGQNFNFIKEEMKSTMKTICFILLKLQEQKCICMVVLKKKASKGSGIIKPCWEDCATLEVGLKVIYAKDTA